MKIAVLCGGPSPERGISLNSARSVLDHLGGDDIEIIPIYFDYQKKPYRISKYQLYSNTPSDFDFKLKETAKKLSTSSLVKLLKQVDIVFPTMHGAFGEDGQIQQFLEEYDIPFIGSGAQTCKQIFDKYNAHKLITAHGFFALPTALLKIYHSDHEKILDDFFKTHHIKRAVVKPATGGSSIGVFSVNTPEQALEKARLLFSKRMDTRVVVEPFCTGIEFTVIMLQNRFGMPVAIIPTEIETDYSKNQFFDYRRKYLPTRQVHYHCPPRFDNHTIERIQVAAEQLFQLFKMRDFARFDGWLLPDGKIWFSDFNTVSGMEQNSFLFQQASRIGMSHRDILRYVAERACARYNIPFPKANVQKKLHRKKVHVLFGGTTSERQVSVMSGTNAYLKLRNSKKYEPKPFLLDMHNDVWELPYTFTLNHTVEEIHAMCARAKTDAERLQFLIEKAILRLAISSAERSEQFFIPRKMSLPNFIKKSPFVFIGLHGGIGENGTLQKMLAHDKIPFNGPDATASALCMDKWHTAETLRGLEKQGICMAKSRTVPMSSFKKYTPHDYACLWGKLCAEFKTRTIIGKPRAEGCSSGVVRIFSASELEKYVHMIQKNISFIPAETFKNQHTIIEMPPKKVDDILFEKFIPSDRAQVKANTLKYKEHTGWIEVTVGVLEIKGRLHAMNPSFTVAEGGVLSVEEKFQGGTGINITPPLEIVSPRALSRTKQHITAVAHALGIRGYCRIDAFMHINTGDIIVLEANTLPALTPSTVLFHQGLAEEKPITPQALIESLIENKGY